MRQDPKSVAKLRRLKLVTEVVCQTDTAKMTSASAKVANLETQIAKLREQMNAPLASDIDPHTIQITAKHRVWIERCIRGLNLEVARAIAERDVAAAALAQSSGRKEVLARLITKFSKSFAE